MSEFWESSFQNKQMMWGWKPADVTVEVKELFLENKLKKILIPGFGYGRNAKVFIDDGFDVTGIEISKTAIHLADQYLEGNYQLHHGTTISMPYDQQIYNGVYCYALLHLLSAFEREKLIKDCYNQLNLNGIMVFITLSTNDLQFGKGKETAKNTYLTKHGVELFFYDYKSVEKDFRTFGLLNAEEINEPIKNTANKPSQRFWKIICRKEEETFY